MSSCDCGRVVVVDYQARDAPNHSIKPSYSINQCVQEQVEGEEREDRDVEINVAQKLAKTHMYS